MWLSNFSKHSPGVITLLNHCNGYILPSEGDCNGHFLIHVYLFLFATYLFLRPYQAKQPCRYFNCREGSDHQPMVSRIKRGSP